MAKGTTSGLLEQPRAQTVFKHELLNQYVVLFATKTASTHKDHRAVVVDGFAGRGRYPDGRRGSAAYLLEAAEKALRHAQPKHVEVLLYERHRADYEHLAAVTDEFKDRGVAAEALHDEVQRDLERLLTQAAETPLFLFLDPCGANLPFDTLVEVLGAKRRDRQYSTESLLNFSSDLTRRVGGHLTADLDSGTLRTMDAVCGGSWWRDAATQAYESSPEKSWRQAVDAVANEYGRRLAQATSMGGSATPVYRRR